MRGIYNVVSGTYLIRAIVTDIYGYTAEATCNGYYSCFVAGTQVFTEDGFKNIEDIKKGEKVWSYGRNSNQYELKKVVNTIVGTSDVFVEIIVGNETIKCTPIHRFYVDGKGWIAAKNLVVGDKLTPKDFRSKNVITDIKYIEDKENPLKVYNITVENNHNYLVGRYQLLVHNAKSPGECFISGTHVLTESGLKNIEDIRIGDKVWSINLETNERELQPVINTRKLTTNELLEVKIGNNVITVTLNHRFYVDSKGWTAAEELNVGDKIISGDSNDSCIVEYIENISNSDNEVNVYNLTVKNNHNYLIGDDNLMVEDYQHNHYRLLLNNFNIGR